MIHVYLNLFDIIFVFYFIPSKNISILGNHQELRSTHGSSTLYAIPPVQWCKTTNVLHSKQRNESHVPYKFAPLKARFKGRYIQISYLYKGNKAYLPLWSCKRDGWINHCIWWYCSSFIVVIWKKLFYKNYFWLRFIWYLYVVG